MNKTPYPLQGVLSLPSPKIVMVSIALESHHLLESNSYLMRSIDAENSSFTANERED